MRGGGRVVLAGEFYIFGPTAMGDLDGDGSLEVIVAGDRVVMYDAVGALVDSITLPGFCSRGPVLTDYDGDLLPDILVATDDPSIEVYSGLNGAVLHSVGLAVPPGAPAPDQDFQPLVSDLDADGVNDVFSVYGRGWSSPDPENNWGRAFAQTLAGTGPGWPTFAHDHHHSGNYHYPTGALVNPFFADGFESGSTERWSESNP